MRFRSNVWGSLYWLTAPLLAVSVALSAQAVDWLPDFGFSDDEEDAKKIWDGGDQYVRLQKQDAGSGPRPPLNNHPVTLNPKQLSLALASLEMRLKRGSDKVIPVFVRSEIRVLSKFLAVGLAEAAPDEDVTFAVIGMHRGEGVGLFGKDLFGKSQKATTGRVFYQNGRLNIIFGVIHKDIQQPKDEQGKRAVAGETGGVDRRVHPFVPGSRKSEKGHSWQLLLTEGESLHSTGGASRGDWLVMDLPVVVAAAERKARAAEPGAATTQEAAYLRQEALRLSAERRQMREEMAWMRKEMREIQGTAGNDGSGKTLEDRLVALDELKKKNLISDEEYQAKRQEILNEI